MFFLLKMNEATINYRNHWWCAGGQRVVTAAPPRSGGVGPAFCASGAPVAREPLLDQQQWQPAAAQIQGILDPHY